MLVYSSFESRRRRADGGCAGVAMPGRKRAYSPPPDELARQAAPLGVDADSEIVAREIDALHQGRWARLMKAYDVLLETTKTMPDSQRDLRFVEIGSGHGMASARVRRMGHPAHEFDRATRHPTEDITLTAGFLHAGYLVLRLQRGGILQMAPTCASWIFMALRYTMRSTSVVGDVRRADVEHANITAQCMSMMQILAEVRECYSLIENPKGSWLFKYPAVQWMSDALGMHRVHTYGGAFGMDLAKPFVFLTTIPKSITEQPLRRQRPAKGHDDRFWYYDEKGRLTGGTDLTTTSHYTPQLGDAFADIVRACTGYEHQPRRRVWRELGPREPAQVPVFRGRSLAHLSGRAPIDLE